MWLAARIIQRGFWLFYGAEIGPGYRRVSLLSVKATISRMNNQPETNLWEPLIVHIQLILQVLIQPFACSCGPGIG
jgi:hypothetical protein